MFQVQVLFAYARPKGDVLSDRHVLEERKALEHEADATALDRNVCNILVCREDLKVGTSA